MQEKRILKSLNKVKSLIGHELALKEYYNDIKLKWVRNLWKSFPLNKTWLEIFKGESFAKCTWCLKTSEGLQECSLIPETVDWTPGQLHQNGGSAEPQAPVPGHLRSPAGFSGEPHPRLACPAGRPPRPGHWTHSWEPQLALDVLYWKCLLFKQNGDFAKASNRT